MQERGQRLTDMSSTSSPNSFAAVKRRISENSSACIKLHGVYPTVQSRRPYAIVHYKSVQVCNKTFSLPLCEHPLTTKKGCVWHIILAMCILKDRYLYDYVINKSVQLCNQNNTTLFFLLCHYRPLILSLWHMYVYVFVFFWFFDVVRLFK